MDLNLDETETEVHEVFSRLFEKECPPARVRAAEPLGFDKELWEQLVGMGILTMTVGVGSGGEGAPFRLAALAAEPMGRAVAPVPMIEGIVAARLLANAGAPAAEWLDRVRDSGCIVTVALQPFYPGVEQLVPAAAVADAVVGLLGDRLVLADLRGVARRSPSNIGTSPIAPVALTDDCVVLGAGPEAIAGFEQARAEWKSLMASAVVGLGSSAFDLVVEYVKARQAFGLVLGAFQTVAHRLADSLVDLDGARFLARESAWIIDEVPERARAFSAAAFAFCSETAYTIANHCVHMHGGVGYTMEHNAQLYYRRAKAWPLLYGDPSRDYLTVADEVFGKRMS